MGALKKPFHFKEFEEVVKNIICCDKEAKLPCTKVQELSYD
jgi:hypothetical protein